MLKIKLSNYRVFLISVGLIGILLCASPTIALLVSPPARQEFSEIYVLGSSKTFENIPFNITAGISYSLYLNVRNNLGRSSYYTCQVKMANTTEFAPDTNLGTPSKMPDLYEYKRFIEDGETWQSPLSFRIDKIDITNNTLSISALSINGIDIPHNQTLAWDTCQKGSFYYLIIELWIFNNTSSEFNNRFVSIPLNITQ